MKRILVFGLAAACAVALAQGPGPGGPQGGPGGPGGQRMGQRMGMMRGGGLRLIMRPDVQKELAITDAQKVKLGELFPDRRMGGPGGPGGPPPGGPQGGPQVGPPPPGGPQGGPGQPGQRGQFDPSQMQARQAEQEKKLKEILTESQWKRFNELRLQQEGANALMRPEVAKEVGLSEEQTKKLQDIQQASMESMREAMIDARESGNMDREGMMALMQKSRKDAEAKMLAVLTEPQKVKWQAMQGKPFKFEEPGR